MRTRENSAVSSAPAERPKKIGSESSVLAAIERWATELTAPLTRSMMTSSDSESGSRFSRVNVTPDGNAPLVINDSRSD